MTDKEQIEELENIIDRYYHPSVLAADVYNAGYRKVGDIEDNFISKKALIACQNNKTATKYLLTAEKVIEQAKKETAKEILEKVGNIVMVEDDRNCVCVKDYKEFNDIAEEYGVEIE